MNAASARITKASMSVCIVSLLAIVAMVTMSCYSPADNSLTGPARLELRLPDLPEETDASRAIAGSGGYLYVRALGGPSGNVGAYWGPISVSGKTVIISDIDSGEYANIFVLHSSHDIGENTFTTWSTVSNPNGEATVSLQALMAYPDITFLEYARPIDGNESIFANSVMGRGSAALSGPVTIKPGINAFALTLVPVTSSDSRIELDNNNGISYSTTINDESPGFFQLAFPGAGPQWATAFISMYAFKHVLPIYFYTSSGKRIGGVTFDATDDTYRGVVSLSAFPIYAYVSSFVSPPYFTAFEGGLPAEIWVESNSGSPIINGGSFDVGNVYSTGTTTDTNFFTVNNDGTLPLVISAMTITGTDREDFSIVGPALPIQIPPKGFRDITVMLTYSVSGTYDRNATLTLVTNDEDEGSFVIALSGYAL